MEIDLTKDILCERDPYKGEAYCIECFGEKTSEFLFFYNSHGPFCSKMCYASYLNIDYELMPKLDKKGMLK